MRKLSDKDKTRKDDTRGEKKNQKNMQTVCSGNIQKLSK